MDLLQVTLGEDQSDLAERCRASCLAGLPDPAVKARVWSELTDPASKDSLYVKSAKMQGFYSADQLAIVEPYFERFFDVLVFMHEKTTYKEFSTFFHMMLPTIVVRDSFIVRLVSLLQEVPDNEQMFAETLKDGIDLLIRSQQVRALAAQELQAKL